MKKNSDSKIKKLLKNKVVLITGGAGSIGSSLTKTLLEHHVKSIRVFDMNEHALFKLSHSLNDSRIEPLFGDILDKDRMDLAVLDADIVIHTAALKQVKKLIEAEATNKKAVKTAQEALDKLVFQQYPKLTEADNKILVVDDKWLATLQANIVAEIERVTQQLANRVKTLEERYAEPLPALAQSVELLSANVDEHLKRMGLQW